MRYAAYLFATRHLLGEAARYAPPDEVREARNLRGAGPPSDFQAFCDFGEGHQGRAMEAAAHGLAAPRAHHVAITDPARLPREVEVLGSSRL